jgi:hypothetical protein
MNAPDLAQHPREQQGGVQFLGASARVRLRGTMEANGWLLVSVPPLGPAARGQLADRIEDAVESALLRRGAAPSGLGAESDAPRMLKDQLYRAKHVGVRGLAIALESLSGLIGPQGALGDEDSACLRLLSSTAAAYPVALWLSPTDTGLRAYGPPVALQQLVRALPEQNAPSATPDFSAKSAKSANTGLDQWRMHARMLDDAQGPKPLSAIETLFVDAYVPLSETVRSSGAEARARDSLMRFSASFEKSYTETFAASKVTQKRPKMVLDVPAIAMRVARIHGARNITLVLVDGMRFDVAMRLERLIQNDLHGRIALAERVVLWSALPATTAVQLRLLDKGPQALVSALDTLEMREAEFPIGVGRTASTLRRIRVGGRELFKLDVIQAELKACGLPEPQRLDALAQAAAYPLIQLASTMQAQTLLFIFGDHGFVLPSTEAGTGPAERTGARPEEVLVAGQAWIVGEVH